MLDFSPSEQFRGMNVSGGTSGGAMSALTDIPSGLGGMHGVDMTTNMIGIQNVTSSPLLLSGDESMVFPGTYSTPSPHQPQQPLTRPPSGSNSTSSSATLYNKDPLTEPALVDPHVRYYFDSVMPMQYAFASERAHGILQSVCTSS